MHKCNSTLYYTHFEITGGPCNLIGSNWCESIIFALNCLFFPANEEPTLKTKQPIRFQGLFKVTNKIAGKKKKSIMWQILQLLFPKLLFFFFPKNWMNSISNQLSTALIKYLNWPRPVFGQFNNGDNKVVIEPRVVRFWSEIILVISNRNHALTFRDREFTFSHAILC